VDTKETIQVNSESVFNVKDLSVSYGDFVAIKNVNMDITKNKNYSFYWAFRLWKKYIDKNI
jgi:Gpi18-like mannosyltransferase